ncbi:hypothetical protein BOX05_gp52 [Gordonia phage GAL1]|uniref:Uncharacterized protein n=1 Tax=Gordonia phage GAL1 TaxID=1647469 RepID=A0A159B6E6_9CAUD|nr:hypothetical protein BOX05_gp52 [Gordonia phage GAL1]AKJ72067.1 hypothetical protein GAL1_52 [Gordonia phage GAL1]
MTSCVVCGGTGQMVRLKPGHRTGDLIPCPNCAAREHAQHLLRKATQ